MTFFKCSYSYKQNTVSLVHKHLWLNPTMNVFIFHYPDFDDASLAGHTLSLFIDGTETSSTALSYALYELALNPACQENALDEIVKVISKHGGEVTNEGLQEMIYIEGILHESMRMHPPLMVMTKLCTQPYTLPKTSGQSEPTTINPGTAVNINMWGIHM